ADEDLDDEADEDLDDEAEDDLEDLDDEADEDLEDDDEPEDLEDEADDEAEDEIDEPEPEPEPQPKKIPARKIARWAAEQVQEMSGKESEAITSVRKTEDGYVVGLEVVESRKIPETSDILATYEAEMDSDGELISYHRVKRYTRGRGDDD
ncbi:gas vesicle protein, partial [Actinomycetospora straminea]